jgi:hypothetical protein
MLSAETTFDVPAPEDYTWDKMVYVSDEMVSDIGVPITVFPTDTVVIVDQVDVAYMADISFTLLEEWDDSLELVGYELPPGSATMPGIDVTTGTNSLTWSVTDLPGDWSYVITKTFSVAEGYWEVDLLTETLTIEYLDPQPDPVVLTFEHGGVNSAPVAVDDSYSTMRDTVLTVPALTGVLSNDTDTDGDSLMAMLDSGPSNGMLDLSADGSFVYTPTTSFVGVDSFDYYANDGMADSNVATAWITVTAVGPCEDVTGVTLSVGTGPLYMGDSISFSADIAPDNAGKPYNYAIDYGDGTALDAGASSDDPLAFSHVFTATGAFSVTISVWNCAMTVEEAVSDTLPVDIVEAGYDVYLPLVLRQ